MITISSLEVRHYARNIMHISWELNVPSGESTDLYELILYRSESPEGPFRLVSKPSFSRDYYIDPTVNTFSRNRFYYYKLRVISALDETDISDSEITTISPTPDCIALEIVRKERLLLKQYIKTKVYFYLARSFGARCQNCWDEIAQRVKRKDCPVCYGTGFECGFFDPIPGYVDVNPDPMTTQIMGIGELQQGESSGWTTNFPLLKNNDYIFEVVTGKRWRIKNINYIEKNRFKVKQLLHLSEEHRGSNIFDIKIPEIWIEPWDCPTPVPMPTPDT